MSDVGTEDAGETVDPRPSAEDPHEAGESPKSEERPDQDSTDPEVESMPASDAFEALGNEVRMAILRALVDAPEDDAGGEASEDAADDPERVSGRTATFSELFEASSVDTTAGFAYHLRQLTGQFLRKTGEDDDRYAVTYAGLQVARAIVAGTYTDRVSFGPVETGDDCPLCESGGLAATCEANYVTVACDAGERTSEGEREGCGRTILTLPFPPGARRNRDSDPGTDSDADRLLAAFDRHHRRRLSAMSDGVCPECAATMDAALALADGESAERASESDSDADPERAQVRLDCRQCGCRLHCPVTLAVLEHPAVIAFYHDHGENVRDRPIWNVGPEWRETVVSTDPWCVRVTARLDGEALDLFVARDLDVAGTRRRRETERAS
ncbi:MULTISPECIES: DUF7351 domain-containing protein [Halorussus]|uniref:DUF7351 domain-containing protein n=1 Tax=Halorussus TaxID=1070314 RepID=UPI00209F004C|nr:ArsR family transcriptional regulator [Halorussus vallis]USZ76936.1 ArsR family transcriptional regulator [Halorussus vallis]